MILASLKVSRQTDGFPGARAPVCAVELGAAEIEGDEVRWQKVSEFFFWQGANKQAVAPTSEKYVKR